MALTPVIETKLDSGIYVPNQLAERADPLLGLDQWAQYFDFGGLSYPFWPRQTLLGQRQEWPDFTFEGYIQGIYKANGVIFTCMLVRMMVFSEARFQWQDLNGGRPGELFGNEELQILEKPWPNGTTGDLLARAIQDADLAGNAFFTRQGGYLRRLRPDWMTIIAGSPRENPADYNADPFNFAVDTEVIGYLYQPGGPASSHNPIVLLPEEVCHFAPIPDPIFRFRGMSWLTPVIREILGDNAATSHKLKFFENGAAQPLDAKVLTPTGWASMGEIRPGDEVMGPDGMPRRVMGVYPQGVKQIYRLTFSNGTQTECCADHLWQVESSYAARGRRVMKLAEILEAGVAYPSGSPKWRIALTEPVEYRVTDPLPLPAYLLGSLLGDGHLGRWSTSLVSSVEDAEEVEELVGALLPSGVGMRRHEEQGKRGSWVSWHLRAGPRGTKGHPLMMALRELGLAGLLGHEKYIPECYMRAGVPDRIALLQGLIDSDGHVERIPNAGVTFSTTSQVMALQVQELARSLGGVSSCQPQRKSGRPQWRVRISRLPEWIIPVRLSRKALAYRPILGQRRPRHTYLTKVEAVGSRPAQCIKVDAPDGLYITDDFIVTHNTVNMVVSLDPQIQREAFEKWVSTFEQSHRGVINAYKTLYLGGGASVTPVGSTMEQMDFKVVQGAGEVRIAAAAGVHPVIAGFSEGLQGSSLNAGNFMAARRLFADRTLRPLWRNFAGSMQTLVPPPRTASRLWYDDRDIAFLREDRRDVAEIQRAQSATIASLVNAGYKPESVVKAVLAEDFSLLQHTGLFSVQLQPPGTIMSANGSASANDSKNGSVPAVPAGVG
jgi:hypothetical protein